MTIQEMKTVVRQIKPAIKHANDHAQWQRVQWLKQKKVEIKIRIKKLQDENLAHN